MGQTRFTGKQAICKNTLPNRNSSGLRKTLYRTQNQNVFMEYIQDVTRITDKQKKRNSELKFNYFALVEAIRRLSNL